MKKNITRCAALLLEAVMFLWYAWPRPLEKAFDAALPARVRVVKMGVWGGALYMDTDEAYRLEDGSKALERYCGTKRKKREKPIRFLAFFSI